VNNRIQILDPEGRFKDEWPSMHGVYSIRFTADGEHLWAGNGFVNKFFKYDLAGRLIREATWGTFGIAPGAIWCPHGFDTDSDGNLYVAEDYSGRIQKFRPLADADPNDPQLIGPLCV
jgi:sugar lactone lactonase YvrE